MSDRDCMVCGEKDDPDIRHVGVECGYMVNEDDIVPDAKEEQIFREIPEDFPLWGVSRRYANGTRDEFEVETLADTITRGGSRVSHSKINTTQVPVPPIRLAQDAVFTITCCKSCRSDFLQVLKRWRNGEYKNIEWR